MPRAVQLWCGPGLIPCRKRVWFARSEANSHRKKANYFEWSPPCHFKAYSIWHFALKHCIWHLFSHSHSICHSFWHSLFYYGIYSGFLSASFLAFYLAFYLTSILTFYLAFSLTFSSGILSKRVRGPLRSSACSWGPAGTTLILGLLFGSGGDHCDLAGPAGTTLILRLLFGLLFGSLWLWACGSGPAGTTLILTLLFGSCVI